MPDRGWYPVGELAGYTKLTSWRAAAGQRDPVRRIMRAFVERHTFGQGHQGHRCRICLADDYFHYGKIKHRWHCPARWFRSLR